MHAALKASHRHKVYSSIWARVQVVILHRALGFRIQSLIDQSLTGGQVRTAVAADHPLVRLKIARLKGVKRSGVFCCGSSLQYMCNAA